MVSAGVLACFAFVFRWRLPFRRSCPASARHGLDGAFAGCPRRRQRRKLQVRRRGCQQGGPNGKAIEVRAFLSRDTRRGRDDVRLLAAKSIPPLAPGAMARETGTARIPRRTGTGHWFLIVCASAERDVNSQKRLPTIVAPYHRLELPGCFEYRAHRFAKGVHRQHHRHKAGRGAREPQDQRLRKFGRTM